MTNVTARHVNETESDRRGIKAADFRIERIAKRTSSGSEPILMHTATGRTLCLQNPSVASAQATTGSEWAFLLRHRRVSTPRVSNARHYRCARCHQRSHSVARILQRAAATACRHVSCTPLDTQRYDVHTNVERTKALTTTPKSVSFILRTAHCHRALSERGFVGLFGLGLLVPRCGCLLRSDSLGAPIAKAALAPYWL
jgi:hypothetical protein